MSPISMATVGANSKPPPVVLWTPNELGSTAVAVWLDADDATTFSYSSGALVSMWGDRSGNGRDFTNDTTSEQPERVGNVQNSRAVVRFTTDRLRAATSGVTALGYRYVIVLKFATVGTGTKQRIVAQSSGTENGHLEINNRFVLYSQPSVYEIGTPDTNWRILMPLFDGSSSQFWLDGSLIGTTGITGTDYPSQFCIGGFPTGTSVGEWLYGDMAELLVINGELTTADRQRVEGYLAHKWGLAANLPSGHPYMNTAPAAGASS
jgi:hypothetical protein